MGYHTIISVSHDSFDLAKTTWLGHLLQYVRATDKRVAEQIDISSGGSIKVIATRHHSEPFYVSKDVDGFPTQLPYDEQLDVENKAWEEASTKARAWLGKALKLRTIAEVRNLVIRLIDKHPTVDAQILAADGAFFARRKLENTHWQPTRADYEALKNRLAKIDEVLGEVR